MTLRTPYERIADRFIRADKELDSLPVRREAAKRRKDEERRRKEANRVPTARPQPAPPIPDPGLQPTGPGPFSRPGLRPFGSESTAGTSMGPLRVSFASRCENRFLKRIRPKTPMSRLPWRLPVLERRFPASG